MHVKSGIGITAILVAIWLLGPAHGEEVQPGPPDADAPKKFTTTESGLKYRILRKGKGQQPKATDRVEVHYKGWLDSGKEFDSSYKRGQSIAFPLNRVIKGWKIYASRASGLNRLTTK